MILKVCLPTTLGLIKEPELLEHMYSKKATEAHNHKEVRMNATFATPEISCASLGRTEVHRLRVIR